MILIIDLNTRHFYRRF